MKTIELSENDRRRFQGKYVRDARGCWLWTLSTYHSAGSARYGSFPIKSRRYAAHRVAYTIFKGPIPEGMTIDHLCRQPLCVNPAHLEAVSNRINTLRGDTIPARNARKTHCPKGHPFKGDNLMWVGHGKKRRCRTCNRIWARNSFHNRRAS